MRLVAYLRVSTDRQAEKDLSIPAQRQTIQTWATQHGGTIEREFVDAGESARSADRPAFLDMIAYCQRTPGLDAVVVYALDRFSRSRLDHALYKSLLKKQGVRVIAVTTPMDESPESIILEGVLETFSEYYSANLSRVISRGMRQAVEAKSSRPGGTVPYGFRAVKRDGRITLEPHAREAGAVRRMVALALEGTSLPAIARALEAQKTLSRSGRRFSASQIHRILHNRALVGDLVWGRRRGKRGRYERPEVEWIVVPDAWPPILDRETFGAVQRALAGRAPTEARPGKRPTNDHLLTGILYCGRCGAAYTVDGTTKRTGRTYHYYDCGRRRKEGLSACPGYRLAVPATDRHVLDGLLAWMTDERRAARVVALYARRTDVDVKLFDRRAGELARWETELHARRERLLDLLEEGKIDAGVLNERLARIAREREELQEQQTALAAVRARITPLPTVAMFRSLGEELQGILEHKSTREAKGILRRFLIRIEVRHRTGQTKPSLIAELVAGSPRNLTGSDDEFALMHHWWTSRDDGANRRESNRGPTVKVA